VNRSPGVAKRARNQWVKTSGRVAFEDVEFAVFRFFSLDVELKRELRG